MSQLYTIPDRTQLERVAAKTPGYMRPNTLPQAVALPGFLSGAQCDKILEEGMRIEGYNFGHCHATTREFERPLPEVLSPISEVARWVNSVYWQFDLDNDPAAWLQTYEQDGDYSIHTDGYIGQTRKLTAVAQLSDSMGYEGGELVLQTGPSVEVGAPRERGSILIFMPWAYHYVSKLRSGVRQTINLGFWGPPFK